MGRPAGYWLTRFLFLRLIGFIYLMAFLVLANQAPALFGETGLLPAMAYLETIGKQFLTKQDAFLALPSLFWFKLTDPLMTGLACLGAGLSLLVVLGFANAILMTLIWFLYMSFVHIGQIWYGYGWEIQLLETGFLAIFLCPLIDPRPFPKTPPPEPVIWLLRWLAFRIMLGAGLIKIRGDACWRDLSCLSYHYETQPIPNPLSRWIHFRPAWFHEAGVLWNHLTELIAPFFIFGPRAARHIAGGLLVFFQIILILSGNLSFLNWLTIAPCIACFDDGFLRHLLPKWLVARADRAAALAGSRPGASKIQPVVAWALVVLILWQSVAPVRNLFSNRQIMNTSFNQLHLVNTYGAFGSVGRQRPEIIIEGTGDSILTSRTEWKAYEFKAKPGDPDRRPSVVSPYHHRIDWQIWFAAMSDPAHHPWVVHLVWKLLHNDPQSLGLLANNPFPDAPPKFIRAELYRYRFAPSGPGAGRGVYWHRERLGVWLPPLWVDHPDFRRFLAAHGWIRP